MPREYDPDEIIARMREDRFLLSHEGEIPGLGKYRVELRPVGWKGTRISERQLGVIVCLFGPPELALWDVNPTEPQCWPPRKSAVSESWWVPLSTSQGVPMQIVLKHGDERLLFLCPRHEVEGWEGETDSDLVIGIRTTPDEIRRANERSARLSLTFDWWGVAGQVYAFFGGAMDLAVRAEAEIRDLLRKGQPGKLYAGGCEQLSLQFNDEWELVAHGHRLSPEKRVKAEEAGIRII